jgi:hypothetical protein
MADRDTPDRHWRRETVSDPKTISDCHQNRDDSFRETPSILTDSSRLHHMGGLRCQGAAAFQPPRRLEKRLSNNGYGAADDSRGDGIDHLQERKAMEVGVTSVDFPDAMFAHEHGCVDIMQNVPGQVRDFGNNLG